MPPEGRWDGRGVLQAKFKTVPSTTKADTDWFLNEVRKELNPWIRPDSSRVKRNLVPEYLVFTTNVVLSPDPGRGGIDRANELIEVFVKQKGLGLKGWAVWHHDQISRYLDVHDGVRRTYAGLTTTGDVLAEVQRALRDLSPDKIPATGFSELLTGHVAKELLDQQWVRLGQAGSGTNQKLQLSDVAIDLPAHLGQGLHREEKQYSSAFVVVAHIVERGDTIRRRRPKLPNLARVGGPGQGKTTLGQLLCQVYRVALLKGTCPGGRSGVVLIVTATVAWAHRTRRTEV